MIEFRFPGGDAERYLVALAKHVVPAERPGVSLELRERARVEGTEAKQQPGRGAKLEIEAEHVSRRGPERHTARLGALRLDPQPAELVRRDLLDARRYDSEAGMHP